MAPASPPIRALAALLPEPVARRLRRYRQSYARSKIEAILARSDPPHTRRAENDFDRLQQEFTGIPEYGYDSHSTWKRGMERALELAEMLPDKNASGRVLEVGCGDGMPGLLLSLHGHQVTLSDMEDWRDPRAKSLAFCRRILEDGLPYDPETFDLIYSYNSFEHFKDPGVCFRELTRLIKPSGIVRLSFGPLYASPWGLHAASSMRMPYSQFLFSPEFIAEKLNETGVCDLGKRSTSLQPLNRWTVDRFCELWSTPEWRILKSDLWGPEDSLHLIERYPECFSGRDFTYADVSIQAINVILQRRASSAGE